jgi:hypothetical protein
VAGRRAVNGDFFVHACFVMWQVYHA